MIHDVKYDSILQVPGQEPPTSSKYGLHVWGVLDTLFIMLESWNLAHNSRITYHDDPWCQGWPHPPSIQSGTINVLQVWTSRMGGSWHASDHAKELKFGTQIKNHISWWSMLSRMTQSSNYPVRNHLHPSSMTLRMGGSWHPSIHARELKFVTQVKNHISCLSMMSTMTQFFQVSSQKPSTSTKYDFEDGGFLTYFYSC